MNTNDLLNYLNRYEMSEDGIYASTSQSGYWSNLDKDQNAKLLDLARSQSTKAAIKKIKPELTEIIFSESRAVATELLQTKGDETVVDLGCMWGALTIPMAKSVKTVLGVDQTLESLQFTSLRAAEEGLENVSFLQADLRSVDLPEKFFDIALVNGVLEWIPEIDNVVVSDYVLGSGARRSSDNPQNMQLDFLQRTHRALSDEGKLFLAIENRFDFKMFLGFPDPHTNLHFATILPRAVANLISRIIKKRQYRPWIYSFPGLHRLLRKAGFSRVDLYVCWPNYHFPVFISPYGTKNEFFQPASRRRDGKLRLKRIILHEIEKAINQYPVLQFFAPSIIAVAHK